MLAAAQPACLSVLRALIAATLALPLRYCCYPCHCFSTSYNLLFSFFFFPLQCSSLPICVVHFCFPIRATSASVCAMIPAICMHICLSVSMCVCVSLHIGLVYFTSPLTILSCALPHVCLVRHPFPMYVFWFAPPSYTFGLFHSYAWCPPPIIYIWIVPSLCMMSLSPHVRLVCPILMRGVLLPPDVRLVCSVLKVSRWSRAAGCS